MTKLDSIRIRPRPICLGIGMIVLDAIYDNRTEDPVFLAGGSCCNVLTILSYLGWNSLPLARLGPDPEGDRIVEDMKRWGANTKFVERDPGISTPRIIERISRGDSPHHRFYLKCEHGIRLPRRRALSLNRLEVAMHALPAKPDVFYFDRADPAALRAAAEFKKRGSTVVFEPLSISGGKTLEQCIKLADIVKYCHTASSHKSEHLRASVPLEIQTKGAEGLAYRARFLGRREWIEVDAIPAPRLVDAAGSGDWLTAGLIHVLLGRGGPITASSEKDLLHALRIGQALASINCGFAGARGVMYALGKKRLLSASGDAALSNTVPHVTPRKSVNGAPDTSTREYAVCLCRNSGA